MVPVTYNFMGRPWQSSLSAVAGCFGRHQLSPRIQMLLVIIAEDV
jgi:hypothetical protein